MSVASVHISPCMLTKRPLVILNSSRYVVRSAFVLGQCSTDVRVAQYAADEIANEGAERVVGVLPIVEDGDEDENADETVSDINSATRIMGPEMVAKVGRGLPRGAAYINHLPS